MCGLGALLAYLESCKKQTTAVNFTVDMNAAGNTALKTTGGSLVVNGILIICTAVNTWVALSATCTHQGCTVGYSSTAGKIICPCHGGEYDLSGNVVLGPPPTPLTQYKVAVSGTVLTITS